MATSRPGEDPRNRSGPVWTSSVPAIIWEKLQGRATHLFTVERVPASPNGTRPGGLRISDEHRVEGTSSTAQIVAAAGEWLMQVDEPQVGPYLALDGGTNLAAVPVDPQGLRLLVAAIPGSVAHSQFIGPVNADRSMSVLLVDEGGRVMDHPDRALIGRSILEDDHDPRIRASIVESLRSGRRGTEVFDTPLTIGQASMPASLSTAQPVEVSGKRWCLVITASLEEVQTVVQDFYRQAVFWVGFVIVAVTAILLSTSFQLIRGRVKLERMQHAMLRREMVQARRIQMAWLPQAGGLLGGCEVAAANRPASHISGDFYDWFMLPDGRTAVTIGDVSGHGMSAAFLMATTQLLVRTAMSRDGDPGACLGLVNRQLCQQVFRGQFVTLLIVVVDPESGSVQVVSAGHQPPLVLSGECVEPLPVPSQLVMAVDEGVDYQVQQFTLRPGTCLLLYTDGATDVQAPDGARFSEEGLCRAVSGRFDSAEEILAAASKAVWAFQGGPGVELVDDLTFVAIRLVGTPTPMASAADRPQPIAAQP
jgi:sigma-B regulation protein RsbU (phosphoserine phosphatase)